MRIITVCIVMLMCAVTACAGEQQTSFAEIVHTVNVLVERFEKLDTALQDTTWVEDFLESPNGGILLLDRDSIEYHNVGDLVKKVEALQKRVFELEKHHKDAEVVVETKCTLQEDGKYKCEEAPCDALNGSTRKNSWELLVIGDGND